MTDTATLIDRVSTMTRDELLALFGALQAERHRGDPLSSPAAFAVAHSKGRWQPYRHLGLISDAIVDGIEHDAWDVLLITTPPRHGKTELCSRWAPAWYLARYRRRVGLASYEADFAATHGRRVREIVTEVGGSYNLSVRADSKAAARWDIEDADAGMWTAGVGGPITGKGGHLLIVDDPVKNAEEAASEVYRERTWEWWQSVFLTRREPGSKVVLIQTRWHEDDLTGRLLGEGNRQLRIRHLNLPAVAEEDDVLGRLPGEALCPERYDTTALSMIRESVGSRVWSALYQQRPQRAGGSVFQRRHFRYWRKEGEVYILGEREHLCNEHDLMTFATMDPAFTRGKRSDFTALGVWGVTPHDPPQMLLLFGYRVRVDAVDHAPMVEGAWRAFKPSWLGIEKSMSTLTLLVEAQRRGVVVRPLIADKSKEARAETAAALYEAGRIYHPNDGGDWLSAWEDELLSFPVGAHDDAVDCTAYAGIELARNTVRGRRRREEPDRNTVEYHLRRFLDRGGRHRKYHPILGRM